MVTILIRSVVIAGLVVALMAMRDRLRGVTAHDRRVSAWAATHGGTGYMPVEGDEVHR